MGRWLKFPGDYKTSGFKGQQRPLSAQQVEFEVLWCKGVYIGKGFTYFDKFVYLFMQKVEERDEQIKELQEGLNQAINDLEEQTAIVQDLRKDKGTNREILGYKTQIKDLQVI